MKYQTIFFAYDSCLALTDLCMLTFAISALETAKTYSPGPWSMISCYFETS